MSLPAGAFDIARARDNGMRPAHAVIVSLCGRRDEFQANPQVVVTRPNHDWRFMLGLDAIVCVDRKAQQFAPKVLHDLARVVDRSIELWDVEAARGMSLYPVWRGADKRELFDVRLKNRDGLPLARWERYRWSDAENHWFANPCS